MTDPLTPGSEWLLPVTIGDVGTAPYRFMVSRVSGKQIVRIDYPDALIPASRLADLEAEVARLREALGFFLIDSRFQIQVAGNPRAVEAMLAQAEAALNPHGGGG